MAEENCCPQCGAKLPADAPEGLCPRCLLKPGWANELDVTVDRPSIVEGPGTKISHYELLELIGEGGMGLVYLAEQKEPVRRKVALKIVKLGMDTKQVVTRFEAERQTLAVLEHPNIAHVFDAGTTEAGRPYFVMEYVKGKSITKYCDEKKSSIEKRLELFQQVCEGVHHAHQKGIIHRDIKPSNILVSVQNDKPVPKIIDFGIAKALTQPLTERTSYTEQGQLLGTPEYMSPEQAEMSYQDVDTRSDIYSLGVLLYELLTGAPPFDAKRLREGGIDHIQQVICEEEPRTPSARLTSLGDKAKAIAESRRTQIITLTRRLHRELEWIPMKAMRKDRTRRYRSASELADDIQNYLTGTPLIAGPETAVYRARKFVRKHAGSVATVALLLVVIVLGLVASILMGCRAEQARKQEATARKQVEQALARAEQAEAATKQKAEELRRTLYVNSIQLADAKYREANIRRVRELLESCPKDLRGWEWYRLRHISDHAIMTLPSHQGHLRSAILSPEGKRIISGGSDGTIKVWNSETGDELMKLRGHQGVVESLVVSQNGKRIISGSWDSTIKVWDVESGNEVMTLRGHKGRLSCVVLSPNGKLIASGGDDSLIKVWDSQTGNEVMTLRGHERAVSSAAFSPDGKRIISGGWDGKIKVWDMDTGKEVMTFRGGSFWYSPVSYSPDGRFIVSVIDNNIKIWDATTGAELMTLRGHEGPVGSFSFSPDFKYIVSGGMDNTIKIWDTATGEEVLTLRGHEEIVSSVTFTRDGKRIVSGSWDGTIKLWDVTIDRELTRLTGHHRHVRSVAFSPDGKRLMSGSMDGMVKLWDTASGAELMTLRGGYNWYSVAFSPDGKRIAAGGQHRAFRIWDAATGAEVMTISGHEGLVGPVAFSPDGKLIASGSDDKTVKMWDVASGSEVMSLRGHEDWVDSVAFTPDGKRIVSGGADRTIRVWDAQTGTEMMTLLGHDAVGVALSPDGRRIVSGSGDKTIKVWDAETGTELMTLRGHTDIVESIAFSPDGKRIISGSRDRTVKVWDATTGTELLTLSSRFPVSECTFSPDGKSIAAGTHLGDVVLWESDVPAGGYGPPKAGEAARKVVDELYEKYGYYHEVTEKLKADKTLDESVRKVALQIANSRKPEDAEKLRKESYEVVYTPGRDRVAYQAALEKAQKADQLEPNNPWNLDILGMAQYRVGAYKDAFKTLTRSDKMQTDAHLEPRPTNLTFTAMTLYQLGRNEEAKVALEKLRALLKDEQFAEWKQAQAFLAEAEKLIAGEKQ